MQIKANQMINDMDSNPDLYFVTPLHSTPSEARSNCSPVVKMEA